MKDRDGDPESWIDPTKQVMAWVHTPTSKWPIYEKEHGLLKQALQDKTVTVTTPWGTEIKP